MLGIGEVVTALGSPWQNAYAERVIGAIRRECLDHVVVLGERHLKRVLAEYTDSTTAYAPTFPSIKILRKVVKYRARERGKVYSFKRVGGLHHEYCRIAA